VLFALGIELKGPKRRYPPLFAGAGGPGTRASMPRFVAISLGPGCAVKVLILEDDQKLARFLSRVLSEEGFAVDLCARGVDAIAQAQGGLYDLIVLDWMVPETDGLTVCREIRRAGGTAPILMLTARGETWERVLGLKAGADDYLVKPFEVDEFVARVHALLRRTSGFAALRCGDLEVDLVARQTKLAGLVLTVTNREYAVLLHLLHHADRIVKRSDLLAHVWGTNFDPGSNLVEVLISRLRDKFGDRAWMIETVRGIGYRLQGQRAP
jgi:DNA-binding response OmpR family regulator